MSRDPVCRITINKKKTQYILEFGGKKHTFILRHARTRMREIQKRLVHSNIFKFDKKSVMIMTPLCYKRLKPDISI